jgi:hypothetical protein
VKRKLRSAIIVVLLVVLLPAQVYALAGIAESSSVFHYNDYTKIERGHPSDLCWGPSKWCLGLKREDYRNFKGVDFTFQEINVPADTTIPYLIGRRSSDSHWLIYNLNEEQILIANIDYGKVIEIWSSLGLATPVYVNAHNTRELLTETGDSVNSRWSIALQMWLFSTLTLLTPVALIFWYLSRKSKQRYKENGSKVFFVFAFVFLVPVLALIYAAVSSLIEIIRHNW